MDTLDTVTIPTADSPLWEKAAFGAKELDERRPGWFKEIGLETLDMTSCYECILGQLYGSYGKGLFLLDLWMSDAMLYGFVSQGHEASACNCDAQNEELRDHWFAEIISRFAQELMEELIK